MKAAIIVISVFFSTLTAVETRAQFVYFSPYRGVCSIDGVDAWVHHTTYSVYVHAPDVTDAQQVTFRLESDAYGPEDIVSVSPSAGVTIESGDLFSGMQLSIPTGPLEHEELLTITVALNEPQSYGIWNVAWVRDVTLLRASGDAPLPDVQFFLTHCYQSSTWIQWMHPDTVEVPIGSSMIVDLPCLGHSTGGLTGTDLEVSEPLGWVTECTSCAVFVNCGACPWDVQTVKLHVAVPLGTAADTVDEVQITPTGPCCLGSGTTLFIKASQGVATEQTTWGRVKSKFK